MGKTLCIGVAGAGRGCYLHVMAYRKVSGCRIRLKTVFDIDAGRAASAARQFGFEQSTGDFLQLLNDPDIDILDICTPPATHLDFAEKALAAGKHVICEKPLTGFFGRSEDIHPIGNTVSRHEMYKEVIARLDSFKKLCEASPCRFFFAQNDVYAAAVQQTAEVIKLRKSKILYQQGEYSLKGSSSPVAGEWRFAGGGSLARNGCHPLSSILYLKSVEAAVHQTVITPLSVIADVGVTTTGLLPEAKRGIAANPIDVEDFGTLVLTFSDGSKATVTSTDVVVGGTQNTLNVYCNDAAFRCNTMQHDAWRTYFTDEKGIEQFELAEMIPFKQGWTNALVADEVLRGYVGEMQDFVAALIYNKPACSQIDLACQITKIIYAAYLSAEEGRRVDLT